MLWVFSKMIYTTEKIFTQFVKLAFYSTTQKKWKITNNAYFSAGNILIKPSFYLSNTQLITFH